MHRRHKLLFVQYCITVLYSTYIRFIQTPHPVTPAATFRAVLISGSRLAGQIREPWLALARGSRFSQFLSVGGSRAASAGRADPSPNRAKIDFPPWTGLSVKVTQTWLLLMEFPIVSFSFQLLAMKTMTERNYEET